MAESVEEMTPLKQKLDDFGNFLSKVGLAPWEPAVGIPCCRAAHRKRKEQK